MKLCIFGSLVPGGFHFSFLLGGSSFLVGGLSLK